MIFVDDFLKTAHILADGAGITWYTLKIVKLNTKTLIQLKN